MKPNGPAVGFSKRYPTQASDHDPDTPRQRGQKSVTVQGGYGVVFASRPDSYRDVTVQDLYCGQVRVSGCKFQQDLS